MPFNLEVCVNCPLNKTPVLSKPNPKAKYIVIGEAPGANEERKGEPFIGRAGEVLNQLLDSAGIDRGDCYITNAVKCYPTVGEETRKPKPREIKQCSIGLWDEIKDTGADVIITVGSVPLSLFSDKSITSMHGRSFKYNDYTVIAMYHPAAGMHNPNLRDTIKLDYLKLKKLTVVKDDDFTLGHSCNTPRDGGLCAVDVETNADDTIKCMATCYQMDRADWSVAGVGLDDFRPIFHNAKADARWLGYDLKYQPFEDTMLMAAITSNYPVGLKALAPNKCGIVMETLEQVKARCKVKTIFDIPLDVLGPYNARDALATFRLYHALKEEWYTSADDLYTMEKALVPVVMDMEARGVMIDLKVLRSIVDELDINMTYILNSYTDVNLMSPVQVGHKLVAEGIPLRKRTASGDYCTDESVLFPLKGQHPLVDAVLKVRELHKEYESVVGLMEDADDACRVHTNYNQAGAATGRWSSSGPNLQNIKRGRMRTAFRAKPGHLLVKADVSQAELKVLAWLSQDPVMLDAYRTGKDIHDITERAIFGTSHVHRVPAKTTNFSTTYGISAISLAEKISEEGVPTSRPEAQRFINGFWTTYRGANRYRNELREHAKTSCILHNWYGRMYRIEKLRYPDSFEEGMRMAMDYPVQGTVADYVKAIMLLHPDWPYVLQVHDELVLEVPEREAQDYAKELLVAHARVSNPFPLALNMEVKVGNNWGEMTEVKSGALPKA